MAKRYLTGIGIRGVAEWLVCIKYYQDTPDKNHRIYYCGGDSGVRYQHLGNASKVLERYISRWVSNGIAGDRIVRHYETKNEYNAKWGVSHG